MCHEVQILTLTRAYMISSREPGCPLTYELRGIAVRDELTIKIEIVCLQNERRQSHECTNAFNP